MIDIQKPQINIDVDSAEDTIIDVTDSDIQIDIEKEPELDIDSKV